MWIIWLFLVVCIVAVLIGAINRTPEQDAIINYGHKNVAMTCPHCNAQGEIRTKQVKLKRGLSGGKATAAVITGGLSVLATGLSRKEGSTQAHCGSCGNTWTF